MEIYWNKEMECMPREQLAEVQGKRLFETIKRVYENVPYYAQKMKQAGIKPEDIKSVDDLKKLPFTYKTDLRDNYPFDTFAVGMDQIVRLHASSGTTGKPTVVGYTKNDLEIWSEVVARALYSIGVAKNDILHVSYGYGLFTGGLGLHYGGEKAGASVVPASAGNTQRQIMLLKDFGATAIACTPSYALYLADEIAASGVTIDELKLRVGIFGAEPWSEQMRDEIQKKLGIQAYNIYGLSEISGPGVSMECTQRCGMHIAADHFIPEIIDPDTGEVLPEGEQGELVFTCITKEALPLIRYRTRDITKLSFDKCACGRTSPRMDRVTGRSDDMLIIRGVNVFPSQIESVILKFAEVVPHYMIYVDRIDNLDVLSVEIEMREDLFSDEVRKIEGIERRLTSGINSTLGLSVNVKLVEPRSIPRSEGKAKRVTDRRKI